jgi:hypothetical protein
MSLFARKARPIKRDVTTFRDDRLFIVACDDTFAPKQYFEFFKITRVQIHVVPTQDGTSSAGRVLERLMDFDHEEDDELWMLLDTDHFASGNHLRSFKTALKNARQKGVNVALSKPCFELWLLLHCVDEPAVRDLPDAFAVETMLRSTLGEYNKRRLKQEHYPIGLIPDAIKRAERLDAVVAGGDIPSGNCSRIYQLWRAIIDKALPSQLPTILLELKS